MWVDGAHLNIDAKKAMGIVVGGDPLPIEEERMSDEEFSEWIRSVPEEFPEVFDYREYSRCLARYFLLLLEEGHEFDGAWGAFDAAREKWPDINDRGFSGFMCGWALNAARKVLAMSPVQNPALVEIEIG